MEKAIVNNTPIPGIIKAIPANKSPIIGIDNKALYGIDVPVKLKIMLPKIQKSNLIFLFTILPP